MKFQLAQCLTLCLLPLVVVAQGFPNTTQTFHTRTKVVSGNKSYGNLYPQTYHTGAGTSSIVLQKDKTVSLQSYIYEDTRLNVFRTSEFPWGWWCGYPPYASWGDTGVNAGLPVGGEGFSLVEDGNALVVGFQEGVRWLVCQWWFGVPQLWWMMDYRNLPGKEKIPQGCAIVKLVVEWI